MCQLLAIVLFSLVMALLFLPGVYNGGNDKDIWHILNTGRYVFENGLTDIEPFTCHEGMHYFPQQWLGAFCAYCCYSIGGLNGYMALVFMGVLLSTLVVFFISLEKTSSSQSLFVALFFAFWMTFRLLAKLRIYDVLVALLVLYLLILYSRTEKKRYLCGIPLLAYATICIHATMWPLIFVVGGGYLIGMIIHRDEPRKLLPVVACGFASLLIMLLNPYGLEALTYIFTSLSPEITETIGECFGVMDYLPLFSEYRWVILPALFFLVGLSFCYLALRSPKRDFRVILPFVGFAMLGFTAIRNLYNMEGYGIVLLSLAMFPQVKGLEGIKRVAEAIMGRFGDRKALPTLLAVELLACMVLCVPLSRMSFEHPDDTVGKTIYEDIVARGLDVSQVPVYLDDGSQEEFDYRLRSYYDARAEVFLEENNHQYNYRGEYIRVAGVLSATNTPESVADLERFLAKYQFGYVTVFDYSESMKQACQNQGYELIGEANKPGAQDDSDKRVLIYRKKA